MGQSSLMRATSGACAKASAVTALRVLRRYNGIPRHSFPLFLKECEFRFNYGAHKQQLETLKEWAGFS